MTTTKKSTTWAHWPAKPPDSNPKKTRIPGTFTLRELELCNPCEDEYIPFLKDIKSNPAGLGLDGRWLTDYKKPRYGPTSPIDILDVLTIKSSGRMTPVERVDWLLKRVPPLADVYYLVHSMGQLVVLQTAVEQLRAKSSPKPAPKKTTTRTTRTGTRTGTGTKAKAKAVKR